MEKLTMQSPDMVSKNVKYIADRFPNCLTESKDENGKPIQVIDFDQLRQELSKEIVEGPEERYQFTWPDKRNAIRLANTPTKDTLRPCRDESVDFDSTQNLYIEGDNLEVLKLLREDYLGKVKMIYIDPPYNTGNDFVYNDDFAQNSSEYVHNSGQEDEEGNKLVTNTESNGRFHTDWLNMIYPRLKVAKDLLTEDGVIFISINDNEVDNLNKISEEIFGKNNFVADLIWSNKEGGGSSDSKLFRIKHEHILCYSKNIDFVDINGVPISNADRYKGKDEYFAKRGPYYLQKLGMGSIQYSSSLDYEIETPDGGYVKPADNNNGKKACWRWSKDKYIKNKELGFVVIKKDLSDLWTVYTKQYMNCDNDGNIIQRKQRPMGIIDEFSSTQAAKYLESINLPFFNYSKPKDLISYLINRLNLEDSIILDFFSGSATTAHSVMQLNAEDDGHRKFIMVQLPEQTEEKSEAYKGGYINICEIGKERIRRAGKKIKDELIAKQQEAGMFDDDKDKVAKLDTGFRVLKLDSSNMNDVFYTPGDFSEKSLFDENIKADRTDEDLLFQTMLELGIELSAKIEKKQIAEKDIYIVSNGYLVACFDTNVNEEIIKEIAKQKPYYFVMRDSSLEKDNVADNFDQIFDEYSKDTIKKIL
jgi:adenine-specific DNA-methyltransferase